jgi:AraC-like DNA-binding protein
MDGFIITGKAFCVVEDLRQFAEQHKGKTLNEVLRKRRLEEAEAKQFGMTPSEYRLCLGKKEGF